MSAQWVTALAALIAAVGGGLAWLGRWAWHLSRRTVRFLDDWNGESAHDGTPAVPGVMVRLHTVEELVAKVLYETTPNGGGNLRDAIRIIARDVTEIKAEQANVKKKLESRQHPRREGPA